MYQNFRVTLTLSRRRALSYRNQSIDLLMDWFLYHNGLRLERVNVTTNEKCMKVFSNLNGLSSLFYFVKKNRRIIQKCLEYLKSDRRHWKMWHSWWMNHVRKYFWNSFNTIDKFIILLFLSKTMINIDNC